MFKKLLTALAFSAALLLPSAAFAQIATHGGGTGLVDIASGAIPFGSVFNIRLGTSTNFTFNNAASRLSVTYASTTAVSATTFCLTGDICRTTWPTSGGGGGAGNVATSTGETAGQLAYWTSTNATPATLGKVATSTPTATAPITYSGTLGSFVGGAAGTFGCTLASAGVTGCLSGSDWSTFNNKQPAIALGAGTINSSAGNVLYATATSTPGTTGPITYSGTLGQFIAGVSGNFGCTTASAGVAGCLNSSDWSTFNNKQATIAATWPVILSGVTLSFGGLSTSTAAVQGNVPYFSGVNTFANEATGTITCIGTASCGAGSYVLGNSLTINVPAAGSSIGTVATSSQETQGQVAIWGTTNGYPAKLYSQATSTPSIGSVVTYSGTLGNFLGGSSGTFGIANSSITNAMLASTYIKTLGSGWATTTGQDITHATSTVTVNGLTYGMTIVPSAGALLFTPTVTGTYNGQAGSVANAVTFNNSGSGAASGQTFNGSSAVTISYNTIGAQVAGSYESPLTFNTPNIRTGNTINWVGLATTSQPSSSNLLTSNGTAGVYGTATSTLTPSSPLGGSFTQVGTGGSITCATAASGVAGCLSNTAFDTFNNKQAALTATWPQILTGATLSFGGLGTTTNLTQGQIPYVTGVNTFGQVATGTVSAGSSAITVTAGRSVIGGALAIDCATAGSGQNGCLSSTDWSTFNGKDSFAWPFTPINGTSVSTSSGLVITASSTIGNGTVTGGLTISGTATTSNFINTGITSALSLFDATHKEVAYSPPSNCSNQASQGISATGASFNCASINNAWWSGAQLTVGNGGTGQTTFTSSQLLYGNGTNALSSVATSSPVFNGGLTTSGTAGAWVGGSAFTVSLAQIAGNSVLGCATSATCTPDAVATSSIFTGSTGQAAWFSGTGLLTGTSSLFFTSASSTFASDVLIKKTSPSLFTLQDGFGTNIFNINSASTTGSIFTVAATTSLDLAGNAIKLFDVDQYGHLTASSTGATPTLGTCSGGATFGVNANDATGDITLTTAVTSCAVVFAHAYAATPEVFLTGTNTVSFPAVTAVSTTGFTIGVGAAVTGDKISYIVIQP